MSDVANGEGGDVKPLRPRILVDQEVAKLNRGQPDEDGVARQLPEWDLVPPESVIKRGT